MTSALFLVLINGIFGPIVEELYFRGYLLPRISQLRGWAPLFNSVLFSIYHFFSPWQNPLRILAFTPVFYACWKKNIYVIVHCLGISWDQQRSDSIIGVERCPIAAKSVARFDPTAHLSASR